MNRTQRPYHGHIARRLSGLVLMGTVVAMVATGCADDNSLSGSLTDFYGVTFDDVRARLYDSELTVEYTRDNGEIPVRVTVRFAPDERLQSRTYDLDQRGSMVGLIGQRGTVTGRSHDTDMPEMLSGSVTFVDLSLKEGGEVTGYFEATFRAGSDKVNLSGAFETTLEIVDHVPGYELDGYPPEPDVISDGDGDSDGD